MTKTVPWRARPAALAAALFLGACAMAAEPTGEVPEGNWLLPGTSWKLVELDGAAYPANAVATLTEDGRITGQAPCNSFNATYAGQWPNVSFQPTRRSRSTCPAIPAENAFFTALEKVDRGEMEAGSMLLTGPGTRLRLVKVAAPE